MENRGGARIAADAATAAGLLMMGLLLSLIGAGLLAQWQESLARHQGPTVEDLLGAGAAAAGGGLLLWWFVSFACAGAGLLLERRGNAWEAAVTRKMCPAFMQRLMVAAVSFHLLFGVAAHASVPAPGPQWAPTAGLESPAPAAPGQDPAEPAGRSDGSTAPLNDPGDRSAPAGQVTEAAKPTPVSVDEGASSPSGTTYALMPADEDGVPVSGKSAATGPAPLSTIQPRWQPSPPVVEPGLLAGPPIRSEAGLHQEPGRHIGSVAVHAGDSLWDIVADHLGPGASDVDIAMEWPRWYEANRTLIGQNPDVLLPGQVLLPPPSA
jgi:hypothetical protein